MSPLMFLMVDQDTHGADLGISVWWRCSIVVHIVNGKFLVMCIYNSLFVLPQLTDTV